MASSNSSKWKTAAEEEMESLKKNGTWSLIEPPKDAKVIMGF